MSRLMKSKNRWIDGVLGGIGNYLNINPDLLRVAFLIGLFLLEWSFLITVYIILMILMPNGRKTEEGEEQYANYDSGRTMQVIGTVLIIGGLIYLMKNHFTHVWNYFDHYLISAREYVRPFREILIALVLIIAGLWIFSKGKKRT